MTGKTRNAILPALKGSLAFSLGLLDRFERPVRLRRAVRRRLQPPCWAFLPFSHA